MSQPGELLERASCAAQVFVYTLDAPSIEADDHHHLQRVLRLRNGEDLCLVDRHGAWQRFTLTDAKAMDIEAAGDRHEAEPRGELLTLALALPKGERGEIAVAKATELGVDRIALIETERSVVRLGSDRAPKTIARLNRIARAASAQSRRLHLPEIVGPLRLRDLADFGNVALAQMEGGVPAGPVACVAVGPEGGFTKAELKGRETVGLGGTVLRSETAAIVASAWLAGAARPRGGAGKNGATDG